MDGDTNEAVLALGALFDQLCVHLAGRGLLTQHEYDGLFASSILKLEAAGFPSDHNALKFLRQLAPASSALRESSPIP